jgi:N-acetylglucosaminyl-diphospho-decaprenol L-rhamnosyltransferase
VKVNEVQGRVGAATGEKPPVLSIVVVNSDGAEDTLHCLDSIFEHPPGEPYEVILVDNRSRVPCIPLVNARFPRVRTLASSARQGFSKNYNLGLRQACGKFLLILNNDTLVHHGALDALLNWMVQHPEYGMAGPRLLSADGRIQTVCARALLTPLSYALVLLVLDLGLPTGQLWDALLQKRLGRRPSGPVPCTSGAAMMTPRSVLDQIGLLDEAYDFYFEDIEWCHRAQRHGLKVGYVAEARVTHHGDQSSSKVKVWAKQSEYKGAVRYFREYYHLSLWQARLLWVAALFSFLMRFVVFKLSEILSGHVGHSQAYWNLVSWILGQFPNRSSLCGNDDRIGA